MSKKRSGEKGHRANFETIASFIATVQMYPAETTADITKLRNSVCDEFSPSSPYEEYLTEEIIQRMLETKRQHQLRKSLLDGAFEKATREALDLALDQVNGDSDGGSEEIELYHKVTSEDHDAAAIEAIDRQLANYGTSLDRIQLAAHLSVSHEIEIMNKRLDLLEKKLRQLHQSLRKVQAQRRPVSAES